jgi:hypothetical protein
LIRQGREASPNDRPEIASAGNLDEANGDYLGVPRPRPAMSVGVRMLTATAVIGFGIFHLIGGAGARPRLKPPADAKFNSRNSWRLD